MQTVDFFMMQLNYVYVACPKILKTFVTTKDSVSGKPLNVYHMPIIKYETFCAKKKKKK